MMYEFNVCESFQSIINTCSVGTSGSPLRDLGNLIPVFLFKSHQLRVSEQREGTKKPRSTFLAATQLLPLKLPAARVPA